VIGRYPKASIWTPNNKDTEKNILAYLKIQKKTICADGLFLFFLSINI